jgi:cation diffusion facilitator CzcD-associated flavoprotein CzcO
VTIYEAQPRIGGLWPSRPSDGAGLVHPCMVANQSRHTVQFSDLAWDPETPQFPRAWQVGRYLERYRERYCSHADIRLRTRVTTAEPEDGEAGLRWRVSVASEGGAVEERHFDYLLVTGGYFGKPFIPENLRGDPAIPVVHSSKYRDLQGLLGKTNGKGGKILVVGGQMSGVEITGTIATHLSTAINSPGPTEMPNAGRYSIHHLVQRPTWVFPLHTTPDVCSHALPYLMTD